MDNKIRKLIFGFAICCSCLWFPVSAFAEWTLADVLAGISQKYEFEMTEEDLEEYGILEEARGILQEENERAKREKATIRERVPRCKKSSEAQMRVYARRPGILPIVAANSQKSLENVRKYSLKRAVDAIYQSYMARRHGMWIME
ncbi:MAG: hypothetical protein LBG98_03660 [Puniceicoccales bacterium]|jgi:hypothetical protein|nr:hypothetical protein [Puniceicoccales bacterium]